MGAMFRSWRQKIKQYPVATVLIALLGCSGRTTLSGGGLKKGDGYGCIDPSGMVAPLSDLALASCSSVTLAAFRLA